MFPYETIHWANSNVTADGDHTTNWDGHSFFSINMDSFHIEANNFYVESLNAVFQNEFSNLPNNQKTLTLASDQVRSHIVFEECCGGGNYDWRIGTDATGPGTGTNDFVIREFLSGAYMVQFTAPELDVLFPTLPTYATTAAAAADVNLPSKAVFVVDNADGTSAMHQKN